MATVDLTKGSGSGLSDVDRGSRVGTMKYTLDFKVTNRSSGDVLQIWDVKRSLVKDVAVHVLRAEGSSATIDIGDGGDPNGWVPALSVNAVEQTLGTGAHAARYNYVGADTIDIILGANLSNAKIVVLAEVFHYGLD
jgi:hypothetical protein